jgi:ADP-ribose pyrophosphatase YjhB (NUDIX family)
LQLTGERVITCPACHLTYFHNTAVAVAVIIEHQSKILLTTRARPPMAFMLDLPGGFVDYNESAESAIKREISEELNLQIDNLRYLTSAPNIYVYEDVPYRVLDLFFTCQPLDISQISPKDDVLEFQFFDPADVPFSELAFESTKSGLNYYLSNLPP